MKKILVPTDFSDNAFKALQFAAEIAVRNNAVIHLLHVLQLLKSPYIENEESRKDFNQQLLAETNLKLREVSQRLTIEVPVETVPVIATGPLEARIIKCCEDRHIDLIVMGTQGASGLREMILGSVSASLMDQSHIPVIAVPFEYIWENPDKFLFATNRFEKDEKILAPVTHLVQLFGAQLQVGIFTDKDDADAADFLQDGHNLQNYTMELRQKYPASNIVAKHLSGSDFEEILQAHIEEDGIDMLAMVKYEKSFFESLFSRSMTKKMAYHAAVPILAIPAGNKT